MKVVDLLNESVEIQYSPQNKQNSIISKSQNQSIIRQKEIENLSTINLMYDDKIKQNNVQSIQINEKQRDSFQIDNISYLNLSNNQQIKNIQDDIQQGSKADISPAKRQWKKLSIIFQSIQKFQTFETKTIQNIQNLDGEMKSQNLTTNDKQGALGMRNSNFYNHLFKQFRQQEEFVNLAEIGGNQSMEKMKQILNEHPKKYLLQPNNPDHLINQKNKKGLNAFYQACRNGNLEIIQFLIQIGCNHSIQIQINPSFTETPLECLIRWNHIKSASYIFQNCKIDKKTYKKCYQLAITKEMKMLISQYSTNYCFFC